MIGIVDGSLRKERFDTWILTWWHVWCCSYCRSEVHLVRAALKEVDYTIPAHWRMPRRRVALAACLLLGFGLHLLFFALRPESALVARHDSVNQRIGTRASLLVKAETQESWPVNGPDITVATACAGLSGWYAVADAFEDNVEIRDVTRRLVRTITRAEIHALLPWFRLGGGPDGPSGGLAWSDSGRSLFVLVHDDTSSGGGKPSDAVLRYDTFREQLSVFARLNLFNRGDAFPRLAAVHFKGRLYVATHSDGIKVYRAGKNDQQGTLLATLSLPTGLRVRGLAVDRTADPQLLYAASETTVFRADLSVPLQQLSFGAIGQFAPEINAITFSDHYGGPANAGLYVLASDRRLHFVPIAQARGTEPFAPSIYTVGATDWYDVAASADGRLLVASDEDAVLIRDDSDTRLLYSAWLPDEFSEVVKFCKSLITPDDIAVPNCPPDDLPPGWVIDADTQLTWCRFHPATPDGASWVVFMLLINDHINGDPEARGLVRLILQRYAGLAPDGIRPALTADGIFAHWIDPETGQSNPVWGDPAGEEWAILSTMKIVVAAARAKEFYPNDPVIRAAADKIICQVENWDDYIASGSFAIHLVADFNGGPRSEPKFLVNPFFEGIIFVEQAATYGGAHAQNAWTFWQDRFQHPTATFVNDKPITGNVPGEFLAAFVSLFPFLQQRAFRDSPDWQTQISNLLCSNGAWTDDNGPRFNTVFSAGTTDPTWYLSGYHADTLGDHLGDVTTFPSLLAFAASGRSDVAVAAYHAYRHGARQTFAGGASILYRRSDWSPSWQPNSAGLPDVVLGALGLAELIFPGSIDAVLARNYAVPNCPQAGGAGTPPIEPQRILRIPAP